MMLAAGHINFRDGLAVWRRNIAVHLRVWKLNLVAPIIEPVISVLGFGWGIGALVVGRVAGISYLSFAGAGLLGITVLMRAMFETTYASYFRMGYYTWVVRHGDYHGGVDCFRRRNFAVGRVRAPAAVDGSDLHGRPVAGSHRARP